MCYMTLSMVLSAMHGKMSAWKGLVISRPRGSSAQGPSLPSLGWRSVGHGRSHSLEALLFEISLSLRQWCNNDL